MPPHSCCQQAAWEYTLHRGQCLQGWESSARAQPGWQLKKSLHPDLPLGSIQALSLPPRGICYSGKIPQLGILLVAVFMESSLCLKHCCKLFVQNMCGFFTGYSGGNINFFLEEKTKITEMKSSALGTLVHNRITTSFRLEPAWCQSSASATTEHFFHMNKLDDLGWTVPGSCNAVWFNILGHLSEHQVFLFKLMLSLPIFYDGSVNQTKVGHEKRD